MARFHPATLESRSPSPGEERFFGFLRHVLAGRDDHAVWYRPVLRRGRSAREPQFVIAGPGFGLLVVAVEDWRPEDVAAVGKSGVRLRDGYGGEAKATHPAARAADEAGRLRELLVATPGLAAVSGSRKGKPLVPVGEAALLAGFADADLKPAGFDAKRTLTGSQFEDLDPARFLSRLEMLRRERFRYAFDAGTVSRVRAMLQPQIHFWDVRTEEEGEVEASSGEAPVVVPAARPVAAAAEPAPRGDTAPVQAVLPGFFLDRKQERMARALASPRTLVFGPAGSGKTVFLVARARYWLDLRPETRVLFTCYNSSLASHLRNEFELRDLHPDDERLSVQHYHDLCRRMLDMGPDFHEKPPEFYATLEPKLLMELARRDDPPLYDLILVDEGQDFTRRMLEVLVRLLAPGGEITIVCDPAQDLYGRWKPENVEPLGEVAVERLVDCYRNTAPIFALALAVLGPGTRKVMGLDRLEMTRPEDLGRDGPAPEILGLADLDGLVAVIREAADALEQQGLPLSELAVLYPHRHAIPGFEEKLRGAGWPVENRLPTAARGGPTASLTGTLSEADRRRGRSADPAESPHFASVLERELRRRGLPVEWVARDFATKSAYDISKARLTLSTVHSAKGMDYHTVILLGADTLPFRDGDPDPEASAMLFTGITRARERLVVPGFGDGGWVPELRRLVAE